jgi:hypothetical protein
MATITSRPGAPVEPSDRAYPARVLRVTEVRGVDIEVFEHADGVVAVFVRIADAYVFIGDISGREAANFIAWLREKKAAS